MKLKIAYCVGHFPYQSETYLLNQLKELIDEGHDVTIFSWGKSDIAPKHALLNEYDMLSKTIERPHIPRNIFKRSIKAVYLLLAHLPYSLPLLKTLNFFKYGKYAANLQFFYDAIPFIGKSTFDIVHCQFGPNGIKAINYREIGLLKGKLITSFHGFDVNDKDFLSWPTHFSRKGLYKDLIPICEAFTVSSQFTKRTVEALGIPSSKIVILPVGLDTSKFRKQRYTANAKSVIVTVSRLIAAKGLKYSISAIKILQSKYPDIKYYIVGEGVLRKQLEKQINTLQLQDHIFLVGAATQEQVIGFYDKAQVFVLSGIVADDGEVETQGLVVQEAQSMELPVVISNAGGLPEGMVEGVTGFVVPQKDPQAIADKVDVLLSNSDLREKMGHAGRQYVITNFDNKVQHKKLMQLYREVISS
ncbi:glycosyltransferase [Pontibacter anaerobius]|uniref:Glycosyltransferase n=1 Tax=Pontibacter anaerobius TaxID=2993940 RepID=A0ABT3RB05_9BACT|nr:glycosyltransferase [Pontibacter anaerobius]MCX2738618.1 glycosyltransferase [Pontibacter anaerobius]